MEEGSGNGNEFKRDVYETIGRIEGLVEGMGIRVTEMHTRIMSLNCPIHARRIEESETRLARLERRSPTGGGYPTISQQPPLSRADLDNTELRLIQRAEEAAQDAAQSAVAAAVVRALDERRAQEREARLGEEKLEAEKQARTQAAAEERRKRISWMVGLVFAGVTALGGGSVITLYKQIREERAATLKAIEKKRAEPVIVKVPVPMPPNEAKDETKNE